MTIFKIESIENGVITDLGDVVFRVVFKTLVFRPIQGNVVDAIVEKVDQAGIELSIGAVEIFVARMVNLQENPARMELGSSPRMFFFKRESFKCVS